MLNRKTLYITSLTTSQRNRSQFSLDQFQIKIYPTVIYTMICIMAEFFQCCLNE